MLHDVYRFKAFDCNKLEDVLTQSIPHRCSVKALDSKPWDTDSVPKQEYTILEKVVAFDYPATLCMVHRSRDYYDCVWKSYVRIARFYSLPASTSNWMPSGPWEFL